MEPANEEKWVIKSGFGVRKLAEMEKWDNNRADWSPKTREKRSPIERIEVRKREVMKNGHQ